ncbi:DUF669 domain-containing protein [Rhizobium leguminosarum]|uniref:DUF669 domain-containing protein n=1 Tax=Rhizobium leguminosarum TaxID=384 RepID=UPI0015DB8402|nr:DUF669 domain-containing protein [Rhizobium leguminosarum]NZD50506.1 DUF669 domain-containing protein [Rhizobium leguminosarum]
MAALGQKFDATAHDTAQNDYTNLPNGTYQLEVTTSEIKEEGRNKTLALTYDVIAPEQFKGRKIFAYIDLEHDDAKKQEDGQREFARLCRAIGIDNIEDSEQLHFIAFTAKVQDSPAGVSKAGRPYRAKNRVQKFFFPTDDQGNAIDLPEPSIDVEAAAPARAQAPANDNRQPAGRPAPAAAAGSTRRPWGQK